MGYLAHSGRVNPTKGSQFTTKRGLGKEERGNYCNWMMPSSTRWSWMRWDVAVTGKRSNPASSA